MWVGQSKGVTDLEPGWGKYDIVDESAIHRTHGPSNLPSTIYSRTTTLPFRASRHTYIHTVS
jgi:hypothetical protein